MKEASASDAVGYFGDNVEQFDELYRSPAFQERLRVWDDLLHRYVKRGGRALDMGCGAGAFTFRLAELGINVVGIDGAANMIAFCEARRKQRGLDGVRFAVGRLPHIDEEGLHGADLVTCSSVVEYVEELDVTLALFARLLKPGGYLILSMPNAYSVSRNYQRLMNRIRPRSDVYAYIRHFSSPSALTRRVRPLGLSFLEARYYTHFTRLARLGNALRLPKWFTEDLFVAVFRKSASCVDFDGPPPR
jgi:2-polyprenyl-3-methyl-5-hydroxy-6-metoxy-1,4-benzoquinol methylase